MRNNRMVPQNFNRIGLCSSYSTSGIHPKRTEKGGSAQVSIDRYFLVAKSCLTLLQHHDYSPPVSSLHGICQARILEHVGISISRGSSQPRDQTQVSHIAGSFFTNLATREAQQY